VGTRGYGLSRDGHASERIENRERKQESGARRTSEEEIERTSGGRSGSGSGCQSEVWAVKFSSLEPAKKSQASKVSP